MPVLRHTNSARPPKRKSSSSPVPSRSLKEPIYHYNMGCYEALLGNVHDAEANLQDQLQDGQLSSATSRKRDPDLKALHAVI